jgi:plastocyanin
VARVSRAARRSTTAWVAAGAFALACGALGAFAAVAAEPAAIVRIENYAFVPAELTIRVGSTVRWENLEKRASHSILFTGPGGAESERLFPGERHERRFDAPGRYPYTCGPHPEMQGVVVVLP